MWNTVNTGSLRVDTLTNYQKVWANFTCTLKHDRKQQKDAAFNTAGVTLPHMDLVSNQQDQDVVKSGTTMMQHQQNSHRLFAHSKETPPQSPESIWVETKLLEEGVHTTSEIQPKNPSKIKLVFPKLWRRCENSTRKLKPSSTSANARTFYIMLLWQFNYSLSWLHFCLCVYVRQLEDYVWMWSGTLWQST